MPIVSFNSTLIIRVSKHTQFMLYFIKAKTVIRVYGISGPFEQTVIQLVDAKSTNEARIKFETHMRRKFAHMNGESFAFEYLEIADTI